MNEVLTSYPDTGVCYRVVSPKWFTYLLRTVTGLFSLTFLIAVFTHWQQTPLWVKVLVIVVCGTHLVIAVHPRHGWASMSINPFLVADVKGMYFPSLRRRYGGQDGSNWRLARKSELEWLFVPWKNIANIRTSRVYSDGVTRCAAFDVIVTDDEINEFFIGRIDENPRRSLFAKDTPEVPVAIAFYTNVPPSPKKVVAQLLEFTRQNGISLPATEPSLL